MPNYLVSVHYKARWPRGENSDLKDARPVGFYPRIISIITSLCQWRRII